MRKTIKIVEETKIPGTNVILEAGDLIRVLSEDAHDGAREMIRDYMNDYGTDAYSIGVDVRGALEKAAKQAGLNLSDFSDGLES